MRDKICIAFDDTNCGFSTDRVVADPLLNEQFIHRCKDLGATSLPVELNLQLLNLRKAELLEDDRAREELLLAMRSHTVLRARLQPDSLKSGMVPHWIELFATLLLQ